MDAFYKNFSRFLFNFDIRWSPDFSVPTSSLLCVKDSRPAFVPRELILNAYKNSPSHFCGQVRNGDTKMKDGDKRSFTHHADDASDYPLYAFSNRTGCE